MFKLAKLKILFILVIVLLFSSSQVLAQFSSNIPWHPLEQITVETGGFTSVDSDSNGFIDTSQSCNADASCEMQNAHVLATIGSDAIMSLESALNYSAVEFHDASGPIWSIGKTDSGDFFIDRPSVGNFLSIGKLNGNVGIGITTAGAKLAVSAGRGADKGLEILNDSDGENLRWDIRTDSIGNAFMQGYDATETSKVQILTSGDSYFNGGNVGIGTHPFN